MSDNQEVILPEDIMPSFDKLAVDEIGGKIGDEDRASNKLKKWGPVVPLRQSARIDRSKNVLEKAKESKMRSNLEIPSKRFAGIINANPFNILQSNELEMMARKVGIDIHDIIDVGSNIDGAEQVADLVVNVDDQNDVALDPDLAGQSSGQAHEVDTPVAKRGVCMEDRVDVLEECWTEVVRKSRGKHARKSIL